MRTLSIKFKIIIAGVLVILLTGVPLIINRFFMTRASMHNFYASTCLGGWENTSLASGKPDALSLDNELPFTTQNSAKLSKTTNANIYCGGFTGEVSQNTFPQKILVNFSWGIQYPKIIISDEPKLDESANVESQVIKPEETPVLDNIEPRIIKPEEAPALDNVESQVIKPEEQPVLDSNVNNENQNILEPILESVKDEIIVIRDKINFVLTSFIPFTFATEKQNIEKEIQPSQEVEINTEILNQEDLNIGDRDTLQTKAEEKTVEVLQYGLVEVKYTLDGVLWKTLGFVEKNQFSSKHFEIPIEEVSEWEDVSKIQISIERSPTIDNIIPDIFLDAVWLQIEYRFFEEEALMIPGARAGDLFIREVSYEDMTAVLVSRSPRFLIGPRIYELWLSTLSPVNTPLPIIEEEVQNENQKIEIKEIGELSNDILVQEEVIQVETTQTGAVQEEATQVEIAQAEVVQIEGLQSETIQVGEQQAEQLIGEIKEVDILQKEEPAKIINNTKEIAEENVVLPPLPQKEWRLISREFIKQDTQFVFADGHLFWFLPTESIIWRFNIQNNAYDSVSVNSDESPQLFFRNEVSELRVFEISESGRVYIFDAPDE